MLFTLKWKEWNPYCWIPHKIDLHFTPGWKSAFAVQLKRAALSLGMLEIFLSLTVRNFSFKGHGRLQIVPQILAGWYHISTPLQLEFFWGSEIQPGPSVLFVCRRSEYTKERIWYSVFKKCDGIERKYIAAIYYNSKNDKKNSAKMTFYDL